MYLNFLDGFGIVENKDMCLRLLSERVKGMKIKNQNKLVLEINKRVSRKSVTLYDSEYHKVPPSSDDAMYKWVDLGFGDGSGNTLYAQFIRAQDNKYIGCKIGTSSELIRYYQRNPNKGYEPKEEQQEISNKESEVVLEVKEETYNENKSNTNLTKEVKVNKVTKKVSKPTNKKVVNNDKDISIKRTSVSCEKTCNFYKSLFDRLLIKTNWDLEEPTLRNYIELIITRLNYLSKINRPLGSYIVYNNNNSLILFNSGLLDKFGNDIYIMTSVMHDGCFSFTEMKLSDGKSHLVSNNFSPSSLSASLVRVDFFEDDATRYFDADLSQIDIDNFVRIKHCIEERRSRFPDEFKSWSDEALCRDVVNAIEFGLKVNKTDKGYIKPMYNMKYNAIHYIVPYHVGGRFDGRPELGIILAQYTDKYWQIMTILEYSECVKNIRSISLYSENSF